MKKNVNLKNLSSAGRSYWLALAILTCFTFLASLTSVPLRSLITFVALAGNPAVAIASISYRWFHGAIVAYSSGVNTRGEVRQLPQGAKRQGALGGAFGRRIVCFALQNSAEFLKRERS